uniref:BZIP domain-containing protein n=1 Tax=Tetradesmus obliquus TaxID=3088 RepID=A0A383WBL1_TETOB|eukprot:jgi/Sobl393_1/82/SZX74821.1
MATLDATCLFPAGMDDLLDDPILCSPDFLQFLGDNDLTGPLPIIPDAPVAQAPIKAPTSPEVTSSVTAAVLQPAVTTAVPAAYMAAHQPAAVPTYVPSGTLLQSQQLVHPQPLLLVAPQKPQLQPSRAASCSSSDASGGRAFPSSMPGSPVSSPAPTSSSDISSLPPALNAPRISSAGDMGAKRQRLQSSSSVAAAAAAFLKQPQQQQQPSSSSPPSSRQQEQQPLTKQQIAANKRRAPEIDWRSIDDPAERRRQRRLAKNRVTAARSRERKKEQLAGMEDRMDSLEQENVQMRALLASLSQENASLREQLASLTRGAAACFNTTGSGPEPAVLKCIAIMHLVACLVLSVRAAFGLAFTVLVSGLAQQQARMCNLPVCPVSLCVDSSLPAAVGSKLACLQRLQDSSSGGVLRPRLRPAVVGVAVAVAA